VPPGNVDFHRWEGVRAPCAGFSDGGPGRLSFRPPSPGGLRAAQREKLVCGAQAERDKRGKGLFASAGHNLLRQTRWTPVGRGLDHVIRTISAQPRFYRRSASRVHWQKFPPRVVEGHFHSDNYIPNFLEQKKVICGLEETPRRQGFCLEQSSKSEKNLWEQRGFFVETRRPERRAAQGSAIGTKVFTTNHSRAKKLEMVQKWWGI